MGASLCICKQDNAKKNLVGDKEVSGLGITKKMHLLDGRDQNTRGRIRGCLQRNSL